MDMAQICHAPNWPRLTLAMARADGRYARTLRQIAKVDLLILDDWGRETLTADQRRDLLEIINDRHESIPPGAAAFLGFDWWANFE